MSKILQDLNLGANLRRLRKEKKLTQNDICARMSRYGRPMQQSTYAQIEGGKRNIFVSDLLAFRLALGVTFDDIFAGLYPVDKYRLMDKQP